MKIRRAAVIVAGTFLAMAAATGSTQAQADSPSGALRSSLGSWADSARFPDASHPVHQMCDEVGYSTRTPGKV
ncbi:MAG: hypothetical protein H0U36_00595 [Nocardioidaceae bacterium]|nr:hypothetical protein [Nocardioidaceae bacterium]